MNNKKKHIIILTNRQIQESWVFGNNILETIWYSSLITLENCADFNEFLLQYVLTDSTSYLDDDDDKENYSSFLDTDNYHELLKKPNEVYSLHGFFKENSIIYYAPEEKNILYDLSYINFHVWVAAAINSCINEKSVVGFSLVSFENVWDFLNNKTYHKYLMPVLRKEKKIKIFFKSNYKSFVLGFILSISHSFQFKFSILEKNIVFYNLTIFFNNLEFCELLARNWFEKKDPSEIIHFLYKLIDKNNKL